MSTLRRLLASAALLAIASPAWSCAVCAGGNPANRLTFFLSTIALSILPLGLFTAGVLWLRSRIRDRSPDEFMDRDGVLPTVETTSAPHAGGAPIV